MSKRYIVEPGGVVRPVESMWEWAAWYEQAAERPFLEGGRRVALDEFDGVTVSTVFLALDHNHFGGEPVLFETMVFGGPHNETQWRYHSHPEALQGHAQAVAMAQAAPSPE